MVCLTLLALVASAPASHALSRPALWMEMAMHFPGLLVATNGVRLVGSVLALAVLMLWTPSGVRCLLARHAEALARRAARLPGGLA
ncbi:hypothetical protein, partial [Sphingomonas bacterium]|uniref:hypothetical protein n=1 Tax=Sphingomonas bacterium TaxID=1895847 RepID=UPI001C2D66FA